eukprot:764854-Hanusia_phi.AAC.1
MAIGRDMSMSAAAIPTCRRTGPPQTKDSYFKGDSNHHIGHFPRISTGTAQGNVTLKEFPVPGFLLPAREPPAGVSIIGVRPPQVKNPAAVTCWSRSLVLLCVMTSDSMPIIELPIFLPSLETNLVAWFNETFMPSDLPWSPSAGPRPIMRRKSSTESIKKTVRFRLEASGSDPDLSRNELTGAMRRLPVHESPTSRRAGRLRSIP